MVFVYYVFGYFHHLMNIDIKHKDRAEKNEHKQEKPNEQLGRYTGNPMYEQNIKTDLIVKKLAVGYNQMNDQAQKLSSIYIKENIKTLYSSQAAPQTQWRCGNFLYPIGVQI
jgi:hypothetical protein